MTQEYLVKLPAVIPADRVLVHNLPFGRVTWGPRPPRRLGWRGFRAWLSVPDPVELEVCGCHWAPELGPHYRVRRARQAREAAR